MRRLLVVLVAAVALLAAPAAALTPHSPVFTDSDVANPLVVKAGEEFFIALPSNRTTGYSWTQSVADGKILAYEGNVYQNPSNGLLGAGGQQMFIYRANRTGSTTITVSYSQPFDTNAASAKTLTFNVTVQ